MGEGAMVPASAAGSAANFVGITGSVFGTGNTGPDSFSLVMRVEITILFLWIWLC
jgi:hypothetical protein